VIRRVAAPFETKDAPRWYEGATPTPSPDGRQGPTVEMAGSGHDLCPNPGPQRTTRT